MVATPATGAGRYGVYSLGRSHIRNSTEVNPARDKTRVTAPHGVEPVFGRVVVPLDVASAHLAQQPLATRRAWSSPTS